MRQDSISDRVVRLLRAIWCGDSYPTAGKSVLKTPLRQGVAFLMRRILPHVNRAGSTGQPTTRSTMLLRTPRDLALFRPSPSGAANYELRLFDGFCQYNSSSQTCLKKFSRRREVSHKVAVIPSGYYIGSPRVQFHLNRRFLRRKRLSGTTSEKPFPD